ncbi:MAG: nuclear transport factor 2 family protein [Phycisphaerae bacterium]|nr:nuclear transport factor 2 family protein [Phycisphaerae bacterium]
MKTLLFESPWQLGSLCFVVCAVLLVLWRRTGSAGRRQAFLIALAVSALLLMVQSLVTTDREAIIALLNELADAVAEPDLERIESAIDAEYADGRHDRNSLMARIRAALQRRMVERPSLSGFEVVVNGDAATAEFRASCDVRSGNSLVSRLPSRWRVEFIRRGEDWMVRSIDVLEVGLQNVGGFGQLLNF